MYTIQVLFMTNHPHKQYLNYFDGFKNTWATATLPRSPLRLKHPSSRKASDSFMDQEQANLTGNGVACLIHIYERVVIMEGGAAQGRLATIEVKLKRN